jgi:hypothetical protein
MRCLIPMLAALALAALVLTPFGAALAGGGPKSGTVTADGCDAARVKADKAMDKACGKQGGVAWKEYDDCAGQGTVVPGWPVTLTYHYMCADDV